MNKYKALLITSSIVVVLTPLAYFGTCIFVFKYTQFSTSIESWSSFATYFGEIVSPILTFITFIFLYLNYRNEKADKEKSESELHRIDLQRKLEDQQREKKLEDEKIVNLLMQKCERIENQIDTAWKYFSSGLNYTESWNVINNPKIGAHNANIWQIANDFNLLCELTLSIVLYDLDSYYPKYLITRYLDLLRFLEKYGYIGKEPFLDIFSKRFFI